MHWQQNRTLRYGGKYMVIKHVALDTVCGITSILPENQVPEIAFAGKSNVGK